MASTFTPALVSRRETSLLTFAGQPSGPGSAASASPAVAAPPFPRVTTSGLGGRVRRRGLRVGTRRPGRRAGRRLLLDGLVRSHGRHGDAYDITLNDPFLLRAHRLPRSACWLGLRGGCVQCLPRYGRRRLPRVEPEVG